MKAPDFDKIVKDQFNFLEKEYNCKLIKCSRENWGYIVIYLNDTTGVKITYEFQEAYIFIMLYRLVDGKIIEGLNKEGLQNGYGLDDIILIRNAAAMIKPVYQYGKDSIYYDENIGLTKYVSEFSKNLKEYASDVLSGNFDIFLETDKLVKQRMNSNNI